MSLWEPYVEKILKALDTMPGEAEVDSVLLVSALGSDQLRGRYSAQLMCDPSVLVSFGVIGGVRQT